MAPIDEVAGAAGRLGALSLVNVGVGSKQCASCDADTKLDVKDQSDHPTGTSVLVDSQARGVDPELFKPCLPKEDCPLCLVPLQIDSSDTSYWACCGKLICTACVQENCRALKVTNMKRRKKKLPPLETTCAFCRTPNHKNDKEWVERLERRVNKGVDYEAMYTLACENKHGECGLPKDEAKALEFYHRAADLGSTEALSTLGIAYFMGECGVAKDKEKGREYLEAAVRRGNVDARYNLGHLEARKGNIDLAIRHWRLAAAAGEENSVKSLWDRFFAKQLSKADLEKTLRAHQLARDEMNSEDRARLAAFKEAEAGNDETLKNVHGCYYEGFLNAKELKKALKCKRGGKWNQVELDKIFAAAKARRVESGYE